MKHFIQILLLYISVAWWIFAYFIGILNVLVITFIIALLFVIGINMANLISSDEPLALSRMLKRIIDIIISSIAIIFLVPILLLIGIIIKFTSDGSIFYSWRVIGKDGIPFKGYKFRTMILNADLMKGKYLDKNEMTGPVFKIKNDPRITVLGKFLRKYSLDELPQLWSVLKGDMSLVGPRPAGPDEWIKYEEWQKRKLSVIPGLTCLWQVNGRNAVSNFDDWVKMDLEYIDNWSTLLDLKILIKTIPTIIKGTGI